jgi:hypothetical protein
VSGHRIFTTAFADVHPLYVAKAERKGRTRAEVDDAVRWLTGYDDDGLAAALEQRVTFEELFAHAPAMNPHADLVTGSVCGVRVQDVEDPLMRRIRMLDKLVDEIAKGRPMSKVLRSPATA